MNKIVKNVATVESYTLINKEEKNKIGKRDICINVSNCNVHKINSNYKLTNKKNMQTSDPSCRVKDIFFLHFFERKMLHPRGATIYLFLDMYDDGNNLNFIEMLTFYVNGGNI